MEVDNLLVRLGFHLVEVGSCLGAVDDPLVLGRLCMVVVWRPCWLSVERLLFAVQIPC